MIGIEGQRIGEAFEKAARRWPERDFLVAARGAGPAELRRVSYGQAFEIAQEIAGAMGRAGYGPGHRMALLLGTCPEHYIVKLAAHLAGVSVVPINPDYRPAELAYVLADSGAVLAVVSEPFEALMREASVGLDRAPFITGLDGFNSLPEAPFASGNQAGPDVESSLLYTSGTTGKPKGCVFSHAYEFMLGQAYARTGPPIAITEKDRIFNPLPAFHVNAGVLNLMGVMLTGAALVQPPRFSASTWWRDVEETGATVFHYLGVVIATLLADKSTGPGDIGQVRAGLGAGVEPALHVEFERRFGIPLIELWGMTEMCRMITMEEEPRHIDTRAMGRARGDLEIAVWDDAGRPVPHGRPGEMVLRHSAETPRYGFFTEYLNKPEATEEAWRGGWFHTGDTVTLSPEGVVTFVDRKKNIIRRAGENIAAAEVENILLADERVVNAAVLAVADEIREEEVLACVILADGVEAGADTARGIFEQAFEKMAYYKAPGWILFVETLPVTGTQKVVKHQIFGPDEDPRTHPDIHDLRGLKRKG
ncbi:AMP-binding protein [Rhodalgimonas zhirmunskyi]|uniref:AMP-binding protein n=1 Tax=Rhodalgimonas zhirmunskyi TaxID=2964767 RepID=A0AAJ1U832_9RHOB|nr:AMP-binding protein [Rhodoalgimonas zhirmunskyi]MDQ2092848.1 AMP-binding protein [Rhodoalgimonas zhirmunskyi]